MAHANAKMKKNCYLIGIGMGNPNTLTADAVAVLHQTPLVVGASRVLSSLPADVRAKKVTAIVPEKILASFEKEAAEAAGPVAEPTGGPTAWPTAVFSGDSGFYSGASRLVPLLESHGWSVYLIPGITTAQYLASKLCVPWQNWRLVSAHGVSLQSEHESGKKRRGSSQKQFALCCVLGPLLTESEQTFLLTGGEVQAKDIALYMSSHGAADARITVGSNLSYDDEKIVSCAASAYALKKSAPLEAVLVERKINEEAQGHASLPDDFFVRSERIPMTKQHVRASIVSLLAVKDGDVVWDVGAGTGAVSIDIARSARCAVFAVEEKKDACALEEMNRKKSGAVNMEIVCGHAPEVLESLPAPDAVFIGGSEGAVLKISKIVFAKNNNARIVVSAVTAETFAQTVDIIAQINKTRASRAKLSCDITQISVSESAEIGQIYHLMKAQNPVWLIKIEQSL